MIGQNTFQIRQIIQKNSHKIWCYQTNSCVHGVYFAIATKREKSIEKTTQISYLETW